MVRGLWLRIGGWGLLVRVGDKIASKSIIKRLFGEDSSCCSKRLLTLTLFVFDSLRRRR